MARNKEAPPQQRRRKRRTTGEPETPAAAAVEQDFTDAALRNLDLFGMLAPVDRRRYSKVLDRGRRAEQADIVFDAWRISARDRGLPAGGGVLPAGRSVDYTSEQASGAVADRRVAHRATEE